MSSSEDAVQPIHETSLALLEDPGILFEHEEIVRLLLKSGAKAGAAAGVVRLPREMVEETLKLCPGRFSLADRAGRLTELFPGAEPAIWSCPGMKMDFRGEHRPFTAADMAAMARLLDRLDNVQGVFGVSMEDVPPQARDAVGLKIIAENSAKHVRAFCFSPEGADTMVAMRPVIGDRPWFSVGFTAHGPLRWTHLALEIFRRTAGHGIPVTVNGEPMAGVSGPVTIAGAAAVGNAEILAGIVVNQLLEPGRPCIHNLGLAHIMDMRTSIAVTGAPENALFAAVGAALGRLYGLPSASWVSTEAMCCDAQAALEKAIGWRSHLAAGVTNLWGLGQLESELTVSPAQAVIDDEIISYVKRFLRGVETDESSLALDVARQVGIAGSFLAEAHTVEHFRAEFFEPRLLFRRKREDWNADGKKRLDQRAEEIAIAKMDQPPAIPLPEDQAKELARIVDGFLKKVG